MSPRGRRARKPSITDPASWCPLHQFHPCLSRSALVRDPHDQVFLDLALKQEVVPLQIINPADFQSWLATNP